MNTEAILKKLHNNFHPVIKFDRAKDKLLLLDFTASNKELTGEIIDNTTHFSLYINEKLNKSNARFGIGGYLEHRTVYGRSKVFSGADGEEPRRVHLGIDIWGQARTEIFTPLPGIIHSFAFNNQFGDYGATIILQHQIEQHVFHTLYGHLSLKDIETIYTGKEISAGELIAHFGIPAENGHWPPHLHFQIITDMEGNTGDYPGVCKFSEKEKYAVNCPNPDIILDMIRLANN
ncbi:MAG: Peptidase [Chitinophagaceae bacterium]|nr:Peptidase [Chitinophagaceae bacterium]